MNDIILGVVFVALIATIYALWHMQGTLKEIQSFNDWISHRVHVTNERITSLDSILAKAIRNIAILDGRVPGKAKVEETVKKSVKVPRTPRKVK